MKIDNFLPEVSKTVSFATVVIVVGVVMFEIVDDMIGNCKLSGVSVK